MKKHILSILVAVMVICCAAPVCAQTALPRPVPKPTITKPTPAKPTPAKPTPAKPTGRITGRHGGHTGGATTEQAAATVNYKGYAYVDLGLPSRLKWAEYNIGSDDAMYGGDYFQWGQVRAWDYTHNDFQSGDQSDPLLKMANGASIAGNAEYDAAQAIWGGSWRMPTAKEFEELIANCIISDGGDYVELKSRQNGKSIYFPKSGLYSSGELIFGLGCYWTSTVVGDGQEKAASITIMDGDCQSTTDSFFMGLNIRPVSK